ncbi:MAG: DNA-binding response regulator [Salinisphaeraceae bacterium]|jgi:two-component system response regulator FixJ|nr:DNA-binding response regulator [Salinisphaeraceae bacterium]
MRKNHNSEPTVYIVDDEPDVSASLKALCESIGLNVCVYEGCQAFLEAMPLGCGCILLDVRMPDMSGLELQERLRELDSTTPIIFLTAHGRVSTAVRAMRNGAEDFFVKPFDHEHLLQAIRRAIRVDRETRREKAATEATQRRLQALTPREADVLDGVVAGKTNKDIARDLGISYKTVELHRSHLMEKTEAATVVDLVKMCVAAGKLNPRDMLTDGQ